MKIGVVGAGLIGKKRALACLKRSDVELVLVHDRDERKAKELCEVDHSRMRSISSVSDLLSDPTVEMVVIATTHDGLLPLATNSLRAGKHTLVEKPGGRSLSEIRELAEIASRTNVTLQFGYNHRFHPAVGRAKEIVDSGAYGPVMWLRGQYGHGGRLGYAEEWRAQRELSGGGELIDQGSHLIDLTNFLCGPSQLEYCKLTTSFWNMDVEDNAFFALRLKNGGTAWHHASWTDWKNRFSFEICMKTAKIEISGLGGSYGREELKLYVMNPSMAPPTLTHESWDNGDMSWHREMDDFLSAIRSESSFGAKIDDVLRLFEVIDMAYQQ